MFWHARLSIRSLNSVPRGEERIVGRPRGLEPGSSETDVGPEVVGLLIRVLRMGCEGGDCKAWRQGLLGVCRS